jgi:hypothetical protein
VVGGQALAQRLDHGDAASDRCLERQRRAVRLGRPRQGGAMHRDQRLVGGDERAPAADRRLRQGKG